MFANTSEYETLNRFLFVKQQVEQYHCHLILYILKGQEIETFHNRSFGYEIFRDGLFVTETFHDWYLSWQDFSWLGM